MQKLDPNQDDIDDFYQLARQLRQDIRSEDQQLRIKSAERMQIIPGWRTLEIEEIISTPIPLKMGKLVIALEHSFPSWGELREHIGNKQMERMQNENLEGENE